MSTGLSNDGRIIWYDNHSIATIAHASTTVTRNDGICSIQAQAPPWSHILECKEAIPCTPRVTASLIVDFFLPVDHADGANVRVDNGQVCTHSFMKNETKQHFGTGWGQKIFELVDERVRNHCGTMDCPVGMDVRIELIGLQYEAANGSCVGPCWPVRTMRIAGTLACTPCSMQQQTVGAGGN